MNIQMMPSRWSNNLSDVILIWLSYDPGDINSSSCCDPMDRTKSVQMMSM